MRWGHEKNNHRRTAGQAHRNATFELMPFGSLLPIANRPLRMSTKRPSLGRGLGALLGQPVAHTAEAAAPVSQLRPEEELTKLPVDLLQRGKYQPRIDMHNDTLQEL